MALAANLAPNSNGNGSLNKLSKVLVKTIFYNAFNFDKVAEQFRWMFKDPVVYGEKIRRISMGRVEIETYDDISGDEFKEKIPKLPNLWEEEYGNDLKFIVKTVSSALQNADKFDNAADYAKYQEGLKGMVEDVINTIPFTLLLSLVACIDVTTQEVKCTGGTFNADNANLDPAFPDTKEFLKETIKKFTKKTGAAKYNDSVTWNDLATEMCAVHKVMQNVYTEELIKRPAHEYEYALIDLSNAIFKAVNKLNSVMPSTDNTLDTPATASPAQTYATNCNPGDMVLLINRDTLLDMQRVYVPGVPSIQEYLNIHSFGIGTIVPIEAMPKGAFFLFDRNFFNLHMQYQDVFSYTNTDTAATKFTHHWRAKWGIMQKVAGMVFIFKNFPDRDFKKKK